MIGTRQRLSFELKIAKRKRRGGDDSPELAKEIERLEAAFDALPPEEPEAEAAPGEITADDLKMEELRDESAAGEPEA